MEKEKELYRSLPPVDFSLADAEHTDVVYKLFTNQSQEDGVLLNLENVSQIGLDKSVPTVLLIHGWTTDDTSPWYRPLKDEYLKLGPHNVIYVNWSQAGNKSYDVSSANSKPVGKCVAQFLIEAGIPPENIHVIGHSLGSHMSAFIGKHYNELTGKKIGRITGLDPAGPKFENPLLGAEHRLCEDDAEFVDIIHTDIQFYGFTAPMGHVDFYPNKGQHQHGCPPRNQASSEEANCSHARATLYFIESLFSHCEAEEAHYEEENFDVNIRVKENPKTVIFGYHVDKSARGVYHFETNAEPPFLK